MVQRLIIAFMGQHHLESKKIVSVGEDNGEVYVYSVNDGISRKEAKQVATANGATGISKVVYGIYDENAYLGSNSY